MLWRKRIRTSFQLFLIPSTSPSWLKRSLFPKMSLSSCPYYSTSSPFSSFRYFTIIATLWSAVPAQIFTPTISPIRLQLLCSTTCLLELSSERLSLILFNPIQRPQLQPLCPGTDPTRRGLNLDKEILFLLWYKKCNNQWHSDRCRQVIHDWQSLQDLGSQRYLSPLLSEIRCKWNTRHSILLLLDNCKFQMEHRSAKFCEDWERALWLSLPQKVDMIQFVWYLNVCLSRDCRHKKRHDMKQSNSWFHSRSVNFSPRQIQSKGKNLTMDFAKERNNGRKCLLKPEKKKGKKIDRTRISLKGIKITLWFTLSRFHVMRVREMFPTGQRFLVPSTLNISLLKPLLFFFGISLPLQDPFAPNSCITITTCM